MCNVDILFVKVTLSFPLFIVCNDILRDVLGIGATVEQSVMFVLPVG